MLLYSILRDSSVTDAGEFITDTEAAGSAKVAFI